MDALQINRAYYNPSNWAITSNDGTDLTATNNVTNDVFDGTTAAFNALFQRPGNSGVFGVDETSIVVPVMDVLPTASIKNAGGGLSTRNIEFSTNGTDYFTPTKDVDSALIVVTIGASVRLVRFTGVEGDTWALQ